MIIRRYTEFENRDEDQRIAEGWFFRHEDAGDGWVLPRDVIERACSEWKKWGNVREMHDPRSAVGRAERVEWRPEGGWLAAKIVDDDAWTKVKEGVYKGFSVGVVPLAVKGRRVTRAKLIEVSLVDRPQDDDARIEVVRSADSAYEAAAEIAKTGSLEDLRDYLSLILRSDDGEDATISAEDRDSSESFSGDRNSSEKLSENELEGGSAQPEPDPSPTVAGAVAEITAEIREAVKTIASETVKVAASQAKPVLNPEAANKPRVEIPQNLQELDNAHRIRLAAALLAATKQGG